MGSPEKPIDVEMADMDETNRLNPDVDVKGGEKDAKEDRFTGLKKDELLDVSSQRVWVVSRWILFIFFWIVWVAMLVGAIVIVVMAPRCKAEPTPPWYQDTTIYEADVEKFGGGLEGVKDHLEYIQHLKSKTLVLVNANDPDAWGQVKGVESQFTKLVAEAGKSDEDALKVVIDLAINSLSVSSQAFGQSSNASCVNATTGPYCTLFHWRDNSTDTSTGNWVYNQNRGQQFKATSDGNSAYLDYSNPQAVDYLKEAVKSWIARGADGFQLRDFAMVGSSKSEREGLVQTLFDTFTEVQSDSDDKKVIGLFLMSSDKDTQNTLFPEDKSQNNTAAVVINTGLYGMRVAEAIETAIKDWRNKTKPFTSSYAFNTMDKDLLTSAFNSDLAAGYTLLSYALPGVPYVRSGDEAVLTDDKITWVDDAELRMKRPKNASTYILSVVKDVGDYRVNKFRAMKSLRWDHNEDSTFKFIKTNASNVVAFARQWDKKPIALTFFNPTNETVYVKVEEPGYKTGSVLGFTGPKLDTADLMNVKMTPGSTMILSVKKE